MKPSSISNVCVVCCALWINFVFGIDNDEPQWTIVQYPGLDDLYNRAQIVVHEEEDYTNVEDVCSSMIQNNAFKDLTYHQNNFQSTIRGKYSSEDINKPNFSRYTFKIHDNSLVFDLYPCFRADDSNQYYSISPGYRHHDRFFFVFLVNSLKEELSLEGLVSRVGSDVNDFNKYFIEESYEAGEHTSEESDASMGEVANAGTRSVSAEGYRRERINVAKTNVILDDPAVVSNYHHVASADVHQHHPFDAGSLYEDSEEADSDEGRGTPVIPPNNQLHAGAEVHHPFYAGSLYEDFGEAGAYAGSGHADDEEAAAYAGNGDFYEKKRHEDFLEAED